MAPTKIEAVSILAGPGVFEYIKDAYRFARQISPLIAIGTSAIDLWRLFGRQPLSLYDSLRSASVTETAP